MIIIPLNPIAAPRPRFSKFGTYNPKKYADYKKALLLSTKTQCKTYFEGAIRLEITFFMPIPKSLSKKKRDGLVGQFHTKKPDTDNLLKSVKDALEGTFYKNDSQICEVVAKKVYSEFPSTEFKIESI